MLQALVMLVGVATMYGNRADPGIDYTGRPLYCDRDGTRLFSVDMPPWVAVDESEYLTGRIRCGDDLALTFPDGARLTAKALDAGYLYRFYVADYPGQPIVVDVPDHLAPFEGVSEVRVVNVSAAVRNVRERAWRARVERAKGI